MVAQKHNPRWAAFSDSEISKEIVKVKHPHQTRLAVFGPSTENLNIKCKQTFFLDGEKTWF